ncbi:hypothetical protein NLM33_46320 [Bradyrhizobium sp. CCGUVB1N3]|uniref:hypothetical protein n=1 Tax=Bradyrhizobium sp. CCGUVB1N3 TaxID=2949629 RepID=UPI0020B35663|nr:hypothetical protein [Bradyrhizobium sp. CCGUVB1N3]MCP3477576.1 hypothetical protein [Bradyrhizobium sp. CCGUVB1N3]
MRQMISGLVAAAAVMVVGAAPAMACGWSPCAAPVAPVYSGCNTGCGGWGFDRLAEPSTQYYYVNQGPTYTGPGAFAPYPTYREDAVVNYGPRHYGYGAAVAAPAYYHHRPYYRPYRYGYGPRYGYLPRVHYGYGPRYGYRYAPYHYHGHRVLRRYY